MKVYSDDKTDVVEEMNDLRKQIENRNDKYKEKLKNLAKHLK